MKNLWYPPATVTHHEYYIDHFSCYVIVFNQLQITESMSTAANSSTFTLPPHSVVMVTRMHMGECVLLDAVAFCSNYDDAKELNLRWFTISASLLQYNNCSHRQRRANQLLMYNYSASIAQRNTTTAHEPTDTKSYHYGIVATLV